MRTFVIYLTALLTIAGTAVFAQGGRQASGLHGQQAGPPASAAPVITIHITGPVKDVFLGTGLQNPAIVIENNADNMEYLTRLAPLFFLQEDYGFEVEPGNVVDAEVTQCCNSGADYYLALSIQNVTLDGPVIQLRDPITGVPLWTAAGRQRRNGQAKAGYGGGGCFVGAQTVTVSGVVQEFSAPTGLRLPVLVVKTDAGETLTIKVGPVRILLENGFELSAGEQVTVTYAVSSCTGEKVAFLLTTPTGITATLRNSDGTIAWKP